MTLLSYNNLEQGPILGDGQFLNATHLCAYLLAADKPSEKGTQITILSWVSQSSRERLLHMSSSSWQLPAMLDCLHLQKVDIKQSYGSILYFQKSKERHECNWYFQLKINYCIFIAAVKSVPSDTYISRPLFNNQQYNTVYQELQTSNSKASENALKRLSTNISFIWYLSGNCAACITFDITKNIYLN